MRRILKFLGRLIVLVVCIGAIVFLANSTVNGARDLVSRFNTRRLHDEQRASFPTVATAIGEINARLSQEKTNAPLPTLTPTETEEPSVGVDITATTTGQNAPSMMLSNAQVQTEAPTEPPTVAPTATSVPTNTATTLPAPTSTVPPTSTRRATATQAAIQALPPTNTKRATVTTAPTLPPSPTLPPTSVPSTVTPTSVATMAATTAASGGDTAMNPALAPTSKLPAVVAPGECTDKQQATAVPPRAPRVSAKGNDILNIALIGTDADVDPTDPAFRTDSLVIVSINRTTNTAAMMSIPRDLYLCIPTLGMNRVNLAYARGEIVKWQPGGGFGLLQATILYNLGIPVHYYARIGLLGFKEIVDTLGGIDIAVDCPISGLRFQGQYNDKQTPVYSDFKLNPGFYHMDGSFALWYARNRSLTSDFDRNRRQQQVLRAILRTGREKGLINKAPELWSELTDIVETNLPLGDMLSLVPVAINLKSADINSFYLLKGDQLQHYKTPHNEDVQVPVQPRFFQTMNDFYTPPTKNRLARDAGVIEVWNGSPTENFDKVAVERLAWEGFEALSKGPGDKADKTVVYDFTGNAKPGVMTAMLKALNVRADRVVSQPDPNRTVDFKVVLGSDYRSCTAPGFAQ